MNKVFLNETFDCYSILFDKDKHNFSTSSEVSFIQANDQLTLSFNENSTIVEENQSDETFLSANSSFHSANDDDDQQSNANRLSLVSFKYQDIEVEQTNHTSQQNEEKQQSMRRNVLQEKQTKNPSDDDQDEEDRAFQRFLQEHRKTSPEQVQQTDRPRAQRNSLKDFICDSSSDEELPAEFYHKVDRLNENDSPWRKRSDPIDQSDPSNSSSSSSDTSDEDYPDENDRNQEQENRPKAKKKDVNNFLESLSNEIPLEEKHRDAKQYFLRSGFKTKRKRQELADRLFRIFNEEVFSSKLSEKVTVVWSGRLTATAGHCTTRRSILTALITLSNKVCDSPERCRDTLLHEMCHAAVSLIDGVMEHGHGTLWRQWTRKAEKCYPYLPPISIKHTYDITFKFIYRCVRCSHEVARHSKSLNIDVDRCGKCFGRFELFINGDGNEKRPAHETPKRTPNRYNLFIKEHFQHVKQSQPHLSTPQLMKHLSEQYKKKIQQEKNLDLPDLEQLKI